MFHRAKSIKYKRGTIIEVLFMDGEKRRYDMALLFEKYPYMKALQDRRFFKTGKPDAGGYGIVWNDDVDISCEEIYYNGTPI